MRHCATDFWVAKIKQKEKKKKERRGEVGGTSGKRNWLRSVILRFVIRSHTPAIGTGSEAAISTCGRTQSRSAGRTITESCARSPGAAEIRAPDFQRRFAPPCGPGELRSHREPRWGGMKHPSAGYHCKARKSLLRKCRKASRRNFSSLHYYNFFNGGIKLIHIL